MNFSLDMIWLDDDKRVVHIERGVSPATYPRTFCNDKSASYVIEVRENVARQVDIGDTINW
jgi:uncharacterized membrane protein (UPF0127 family)